MGCTDSKAQAEPAAVTTKAVHLPPCDALMVSIAPAYWDFVKANCASERLRAAEWISFLSTCDFVMSREIATTESDRRSALERVSSECAGSPKVLIEKVVDDRLAALLEAWIGEIDDFSSKLLPHEKALNVLKRSKVMRELPQRATFSFADLYGCSLQWTSNSGLENLFDSLAKGKDMLEPEQLAEFASYGAETQLTISDANELIRRRLGGSVTRLRFLSFFGNPNTNDVLDPKRYGG